MGFVDDGTVWVAVGRACTVGGQGRFAVVTLDRPGADLVTSVGVLAGALIRHTRGSVTVSRSHTPSWGSSPAIGTPDHVVRDGKAELAVVDHGPGVAETDQQAMFAPFHRLDPHGGGLRLGLTVVKGFIEAMHGTVCPSATPGGGLTMTLSLSLAQGRR